MKLSATKLSTNLRNIIGLYLVGVGLCVLLRAALLWLYPEFFAGISPSQAGRAFLIGLRFDLAIITQLCSIPLLALLLPFRFAGHPTWRRFWMILAMLPLATLLILGVVSATFFGEVQRHIGAELMFMVNDWPFVIDLLITSRREEFISVSVLLVLGALGWLKLVTRETRYPRQSGRRQAWVTFVLALPVLLVFARGFVLDGKPLNVVDAHALGDARLGNLAMNAAFSVIHTSRNLDEALHSSITPEQANALRDQLGISRPNPFLRHYTTDKKTTPNIVLVILESWSNEYIDGLSGSDLGVTPNMDRLLAESQVYSNHYAAAQRSIQSIQAILTGVPVLPGQPRLSEGLEQMDMSRIGNLAADRGYRSVFVQSSTRRSFRMDSVAASLGFSEYYGQEDIPLKMDYPQATPRFGWDHETLQFFHQRLDDLADSGPFFGVVFTGTTHEPFADPGERFHRYPHDARSEHGYLNTLAYSDWALGEFIAKARREPWYENTIFVITSDHVLRASAESLRSRFRVPLLIHASHLIEPGQSAKLVSHYDILPTLADLMGVEQPFVAFGESVFRDEHPDEAWVNHGEMVGLLRSDTEISFVPSRVSDNLAALTQHSEQASLWQRAALITHLVIEKMNLNKWTLGIESLRALTTEGK
ncbi:LTA synthase family protein [Halopseudomonas nanhaiensis]|uniref:LTA synthase family protein n=1 Tax=Halopseudomonas nanhaiensis TaxID=2830842 RepID=UPI001CBBD380|nr:LTA synthase family protein [Halopseudomonas nanhaiensis]UAW98654.1 LTA synthase family protein [Halopseudomonas nanhaiensis]